LNFFHRGLSTAYEQGKQKLGAIAPAPLKRAADDNETSSSKKAKTDLDFSQAKAAAQSGSLKKFTVAQLSGFLASVSVKPKKKKDELMDQVLDYLSKH
jgi:hypothetical protein